MNSRNHPSDAGHRPCGRSCSAGPDTGRGWGTQPGTRSAWLQRAADLALNVMGSWAYAGVIACYLAVGALLVERYDPHPHEGAVLVPSILAIFLFTGYLTRAALHPVSRTAPAPAKAQRDLLAVPAPKRSPDEIRALECAFNTMAAAFETSRAQLRRLAEDQGVLHRVATVVSRGVPPGQVFDAIAGEMGRLLRADHMVFNRFEPDHTTTVVGHWTHPGVPDVMPPLEGHWPIQDGTVEATVFRTGQPARGADYVRAKTQIGDWTRAHGIKYVVVCPVTVDGRTWGTVTHSLRSQPQPEGTEQRMLELVKLVGAAIANADSRAELAASRARLVAASDATRHRIERDLHDGVQQRLISLGLELRAAEAALPSGQHELRQQLANAAQDLAGVTDDLRVIARGLLPTALSGYGLGAALKSLVRRSPIPVELNVNAGRRLPEPLEATIYYVTAEALTNALKHAHPTRVHVDLCTDDKAVRVSIYDDGAGGADLRGGSGLIGLRDRVEALGGRMQIESPIGEGTSLLVTIPLDSPDLTRGAG
jgi:signal transduction histidine kinase